MLTSAQQFEQKKAELDKIRNKLALKEGLPHLYRFKRYKWSNRFFNSVNKMVLMVAANQLGKAKSVNTLLPMYHGHFKRAGDVEPGDTLLSWDGSPTGVVGIPFRGDVDSYRLTFDDGTTTDCSGDHMWVCKSYRERFKDKGVGWIQQSTEQIIELGGYSPNSFNNSRRVVIPVCEPVQYKHIPELFDPYFIGVMLGDGCVTSSITLSTPDKEIVDYVSSRYQVRKVGKLGYSFSGMRPLFDSLNLMGTRSGTKFIPTQYLYGDIEQRKSMLAGLMDTDGYVSANGMSVEFDTASPHLRDGVAQLVHSLGGKCVHRTRVAGYKKNGVYHPCQDSHKVRIRLPFNPFRLKKKADRYRLVKRTELQRVIHRIEPVGKRECVCFTLDNIDGTFLSGKEYVVTHNSSIQIMKAIEWSGNPALWPKLWPKCYKLNKQFTTTFWYLYPDRDTATEQYHQKWLGEYLPSGPYKDHPTYGWQAQFDKDKKIYSITFNSGGIIYFKTYSKQVSRMQASTVHAIFTDEEMPEDVYSEIAARLWATDGYYHMVFTATLGQEMWRLAMERKGKPDEKFPDALKLNVSQYDCLEYADGTKTPWTRARIERNKASCKSKAEIQRRIYGRFIRDTGLKYPSFSRDKNVVKPYSIPRDWNVVCGVDIGSGGSAHPGAIIWLAYNDNCTKVAVFDGWRGNSSERTTAGDIFEIYVDMRRRISQTHNVIGVFYDWAARDFKTIAERSGHSVLPADKTHESGERNLNTAFKCGVLDIFDIPCLAFLPLELENLDEKTAKTKACDDGTDGTRYGFQGIPINWPAIFKLVSQKKRVTKKNPNRDREYEDAGSYVHPDVDTWNQEIEDANDQSGVDGFY